MNQLPRSITGAPNRPVLRFFGGKDNLSSWIISHFPEHYLYCEPFGGGASVLCRKAPSPVEVYNDLDDRVVNFFKVLRKFPAELIRQIELTPYARAEYELSYEKAENSIEDARRFYVCSWQGRGGGYVASSTPGWRLQNKRWKGCDVVREWNRHEDLWAFSQRLRRVQIERDDAVSVISRYDTPETLFYVDPPYVHSTRSKRHLKLYFCEMTDDDHEKLALKLHQIKGSVILSGYRSELYDSLYKDWHRIEKKSRTNAQTEAIECLWFSPQCQAMQMPLFKIGGQYE